MVAVLQDIVEIITGGLVNFASEVAQGIGEMMRALFVTGDGSTQNPYALSITGGIICIFAGLSLAVGITTLCVHKVFNLGGGRY